MFLYVWDVTINCTTELAASEHFLEYMSHAVDLGCISSTTTISFLILTLIDNLSLILHRCSFYQLDSCLWACTVRGVEETGIADVQPNLRNAIVLFSMGRYLWGGALLPH